MTNANYELKYLNEVIPSLKDYLLQDEIFWPVNLQGTPPYPKLTLGNVLISLARLRAYDPAEADKVAGQVDALKTQWQTKWEAKLVHEYKSRLRQWSEYLTELKQKFSEHSAFYDNAVRNRALLQLITAELGEALLPAEAVTLAPLDAYLWPHLIEGPLMWDAELESVFPKDDYWFLYGYLHG